MPLVLLLTLQYIRNRNNGCRLDTSAIMFFLPETFRMKQDTKATGNRSNGVGSRYYC